MGEVRGSYEPVCVRRCFSINIVRKRHIVDTRQERVLTPDRGPVIARPNTCLCFSASDMEHVICRRFAGEQVRVCSGWTVLKGQEAPVRTDGGISGWRAVHHTAPKPTECSPVSQVRQMTRWRGSTQPASSKVTRGHQRPGTCCWTHAYISWRQSSITSRWTWVFCETPEYVAPEIFLNNGHELSTGLWMSWCTSC